MSAERRRLEEAQDQVQRSWKRWGPYLAERQWGTVREDPGDGHDTWNAFTHDQARSRAYRWGEDGLAGISDDQQRLCFALALWNGADPILKERLFGLTNGEGNHGEDVKEYYFYLDSTPTHSYMRYLYKYPQTAYPYEQLVTMNRQRSRRDLEYELIDTGVFDRDRYFDVAVEYAKASPEDVLVRITATNRGADPAPLHVLPTLWFRNTWAWGGGDAMKPWLSHADGPDGAAIEASHPMLGDYYLYCGGQPELVYTENETNIARLHGLPSVTPWVKDAFHDYVVHGHRAAVSPARMGTKAAAYYRLTIDGGETAELRLRLTRVPPLARDDGMLGLDFEATFAARQHEADEFYAALLSPSINADAALVMRQALAGMLWNKQYYEYDVARWLEEHGVDPYVAGGVATRNGQWAHMVHADVISMPDTWEYPWYAAWDLAFHALALNLVDPDFAKQQLSLVLDERYLHPSGQLPAYEWNFSDVNPPVHAWAAWYVYSQEKARRGQGDLPFLEAVFQKLLINFTWWVNRKDPDGRNLFEGGFLGLDNIGVFDRSAPMPSGGRLEQADGTAWMAFYCQTMLQLAIELALHDPVYQNVAAKFYEHFLWIAGAMDRAGDPHDLWDDADGFFYDLLRLPTGNTVRLKVRSMVGLLAICASTVFPTDTRDRLPLLMQRAAEFTRRRATLMARIASPSLPGVGGRRLLALLSEEKLRRILGYMLDENEFFGPHGIRAVSRYHRDHPYTFTLDNVVYRIDYEPAESSSGMFGGNSNWRGPVWFPMNILLLRALMNLHAYYGDGFTVECPTGSGMKMTLQEVAREIARRLISIFLRDEHGRRPVFGGTETFQSNPHWRDCLLFYEYFHGDNGAGLGASHQTGWTGLVAPLIHLLASQDDGTFLKSTAPATGLEVPAATPH